MDDAGLLRVLELILDDRFKALKLAARADNDKQHAADFGGALCYIRERIKGADLQSGALAPFTGRPTQRAPES